MLNDVDIEYYKMLYSDGLTEIDFNRLRWEASRLITVETTGVDGYKKLKNAFPIDEDDATAVKRCVCKLINTLHQIEAAVSSTISSHGYVQREDGSVVGKVVSSVSSGSESISYTSGNSSNQTVIEQAAADTTIKNTVLHNIVRDFLAGAADANGVNLLYMGRYPHV